VPSYKTTNEYIELVTQRKGEPATVGRATQTVTSAIRKANTPAKPVAAISLVPLLPVAVELAGDVVLPEPVEFEQEVLDGMEKLLDNVRSAHWLEKKKKRKKFSQRHFTTSGDARRPTWYRLPSPPLKTN
jgi:hypothetical protein